MKTNKPVTTHLFNLMDNYKLNHGRYPDKIYLNSRQHQKLHSELFKRKDGYDYISTEPLMLGDTFVYRSKILKVGCEIV